MNRIQVNCDFDGQILTATMTVINRIIELGVFGEYSLFHGALVSILVICEICHGLVQVAPMVV